VRLEYAFANHHPDVQRGTAVRARRQLVAGQSGHLQHARNGRRNAFNLASGPGAVLDAGCQGRPISATQHCDQQVPATVSS
jgi:hypothetical protein